MSTPNDSTEQGMWTEEKARQIVDNYENVDFSVYDRVEWATAKGYLICVEQEKATLAKLTEALKDVWAQGVTAGDLKDKVAAALASAREQEGKQ